MHRLIAASSPILLEKVAAFRYASALNAGASTEFSKQAFILEKTSSANVLVEEAVKLGSSILKALKAQEMSEKLKVSKKPVKELEKTNSLVGMSIPKALAIGTGLAVPGAIAANHLMNKASDDLDTKMYAIPGLAAATVGAILAARGMNSSPDTEDVNELAKALEAKETIDLAKHSSVSNTKVSNDLYKLARLNTEHIAILIADILDA
jgi:hypothetical protein